MTSAALVFAAVTLGAQAPQPPPQPPIFRGGVGVVRVDVTVINNADDPITDLTAADFDVREDGAAQKVEWLQFVRVSGTPAPGDDTSLVIRSREHAAQEAAREDVRLLVIFLDDYHLRHGPGFDVKLKELLRGFIKVEMQPTDLIGIMGPLTPISDLRLTRNKQELLDRIAKFQGRLGELAIARSPMEEIQDRMDHRSRARLRAQITLTALQSLVSYLGGLRDGRKSVLFVSEGPPMYVDGAVNTNELRDAITAANTSNVTIHTLDPRGLGQTRMLSDVNGALALDTGGRELKNSNDYTRGLSAVMSDSTTYYLLGYMPTRDVADGKFHEIDVKVRRKGVRVLARKGYWAPKPEELNPKPPTPVAREVVDAFGALTDAARPRAATDWVGLAPAAGGQTDVTMAYAAGASASKGSAIARVRVQLVDPEGNVREEIAAERASPDGPWIARFRTSPGRVAVRTILEDAAKTVIDSWTREADVPPATDPSSRVGTPLVHRSTSVATHKRLGASDGLPIAVERTFRRTDRVVVRLPLAAEASTSQVRAELINEGGQVLVTLPVAAGPTGAPQVELPLANLAFAKYALRMIASVDVAPVSRLVSFAVTP